MWRSCAMTQQLSDLVPLFYRGPPETGAVIPVEKVKAWSVQFPVMEKRKIQIITLEGVMNAFKEHVAPYLLGKRVRNDYSETQMSLPSDNTKWNAAHLQMLARNESVNVTGMINSNKYYPGLDEGTQQ